MQPLLYISIFIIAIVISAVLAFAGLGLFMWNRFLKAQLKAQQAWQQQMVQDFQDSQQVYYNVAGDGETVDLIMQDPASNQGYSFGQSYPNPYWQNPGMAYAQNPMGGYHPEMQMGDADSMQQHYAHMGNVDKEIRIFTAIADRIRQYGTMPSQFAPDQN